MGVAWTAPDDDWISYLFVNGRMAVEAFAPGQAERTIDVPFAAGALAVIEVHDFDPSDVPDAPAAIAIPPVIYTRPTIHFAVVPGAARYRLYHHPEGGTETRVWEGAADAGDGEDGDWISLECPVDLSENANAPGGVNGGSGWHFFRVEAVSAYGVESLAQSWAWLAMDVPSAPKVTVAPGSMPGTWTFTVTGG